MVSKACFSDDFMKCPAIFFRFLNFGFVLCAVLAKIPMYMASISKSAEAVCWNREKGTRLFAKSEYQIRKSFVLCRHIKSVSKATPNSIQMPL